MAETAAESLPESDRAEGGLSRRQLLTRAGAGAATVVATSVVTTSPASAAVAWSKPPFSTNAIVVGGTGDPPYAITSANGTTWPQIADIPATNPAAFGRSTSTFAADVSARSDGAYGIVTYGGTGTNLDSGQALIADQNGDWHVYPLPGGGVGIADQGTTNWVAVCKTVTDVNHVHSTSNNGERWSSHLLPSGTGRSDPDPYCIIRRSGYWMIGGQTGNATTGTNINRAVVWRAAASALPTATIDWLLAEVRTLNTGTSGSADTWVSRVTVDQANPAVWYATVVEHSGSPTITTAADFGRFRSWIYRSTDTGVTWSIWQGGTSGFVGLALSGIDIDQASGKVVAVGGPTALLVGNRSDGINAWTVGSNNSDEVGTAWAGQPAANRWWKAVRTTAANRFIAVGDVLAGTGNNGGLLWYSIDGGARWSQVSNPGDDLRSVESPPPSGSAFAPRATTWQVVDRGGQDGCVAVSSAGRIYQQITAPNGIPQWGEKTFTANYPISGFSQGRIALNPEGGIAVAGWSGSGTTVRHWSSFDGAVGSTRTSTTTQDNLDEVPGVALGSVAGTAPVRPYLALTNRSSTGDDDVLFHTRADASTLNSAPRTRTGWAHDRAFRSARWANGYFIVCGREAQNTDEAEIWRIPRSAITDSGDPTGFNDYRQFNPESATVTDGSRWFEDAAYVGGSTWFVVDNFETIWRSNDNGDNWRRTIRVTGYDWERMRLSYCPVADRLLILFVSGGTEGNQIRYVNNIKAYSSAGSVTADAPNIISSVSDGYNVTFLKAYNGDPTTDLTDITRAGDRQFIAVGNSGTALFSYDSGASWFPQTVTGAADLRGCAGEQVWA